MTIQPVCIPAETFGVAAAIKGWVTGWRRTRKNGETVRPEANWAEGGGLVPGLGKKANGRDREAHGLAGGSGGGS